VMGDGSWRKVSTVWDTRKARRRSTQESEMTSYSVGSPNRRDILKISAALAGSQALASTRAAGAGGPAGQITWGVHVSLAPTWFDPAETAGTITPFMVMYALHDAMVKPMPGQPQA